VRPMLGNKVVLGREQQERRKQTVGVRHPLREIGPLRQCPLSDMGLMGGA
jgi:hypothetical protein